MPIAPLVVYQYHATIPAGEVISQDPAEGEAADPNGTVTIYVSRGPTSAAFMHIYDKNSIMVFR